MNSTLRIYILVSAIFLSAVSHCLAYKIDGRLGNLHCFYPRVYLAVINNIDGIYAASYQNIISWADVDSSGHFALSGNDLPEVPRFYRLYVTKDRSITTEILVGMHRNYLLLALENKTQMTIDCDDFCRQFLVYTVANSPESGVIMQVQQMI